MKWTYVQPCPHCGEVNHLIEERADCPGAQFIICPQLEFGSLMLIDGKIVRDNRERFKPKEEVADDEFPEFTHAEDFFDAHDVIEI